MQIPPRIVDMPRAADSAPAAGLGGSVRFVPVAKLAELPRGGKIVRDVDSQNILLCNVGGHIHAVENRCSHMAKPLDAGRLMGALISCPFHSAQFDVRTGAACGFPAVHPLRRFEVRVDGDDIAVSNEPIQPGTN